MNSENKTHLRLVLADETLPIQSRQAAAEHLIKLVIESVQEPANDNQEVLKLQQPWENREFAAMFANSVAVDGESPAEAKRIVRQRNRLRAVLAVVVDESAHRLERLAACQKVLDDTPRTNWPANGYTPDGLLAEVLPAGTLRWAGLFKEQVPVNRPPKGISDVWII